VYIVSMNSYIFHFKIIYLYVTAIMISLSTTCSWINIFVVPGTSFQSTNQIWGTRLGLQLELGASTPVLFTCYCPLILGTSFSDRNVVPGSIQECYLTWQNHGEQFA